MTDRSPSLLTPLALALGFLALVASALPTQAAMVTFTPTGSTLTTTACVWAPEGLAFW